MGIFIFIIIVGIFIYFISRAFKQNKYLQTISTSQIDEMDGIAFEHYVRELLVYQGYSAKVTRASNDYGVDIVAKKDGDCFAVQVKRYSGNVSRKAVSDSVAGMKFYKCNKSMVITNSYFTKGACELASVNSCILIDRPILGKWIYQFQSNTSKQQELLDIPLSRKNEKQSEIQSNEPITATNFSESYKTFSSSGVIGSIDNRIESIIDEEIVLIAKKEYPRDAEMREYEYKRQLSSKKYMKEVADLEVKSIAQKEYAKDYTLQEDEYRRQLSSKGFMKNVTDLKVKAIVQKEYPNDYIMQEDEYRNQLSSKSFMENVVDVEVKQIAKNEHPNDYIMQEETYKEQLNSKNYMLSLPNNPKKRKAQIEYPNDFSMQEYEYKNS